MFWVTFLTGLYQTCFIGSISVHRHMLNDEGQILQAH